jgi:hypothetical protein
VLGPASNARASSGRMSVITERIKYDPMVASASAAWTSRIATSQVMAFEGRPAVWPCGRSARAATFRPPRSCAAARCTAWVSASWATWTLRVELVLAMRTSARRRSAAVSRWRAALSRSDASAACALDCERSRRQDAGRERSAGQFLAQEEPAGLRMGEYWRGGLRASGRAAGRRDRRHAWCREQPTVVSNSGQDPVSGLLLAGVAWWS